MVNPRYWACIALAAVVVFLTLLAALHFLEPEFDPSKRLISEYELGRSRLTPHWTWGPFAIVSIQERVDRSTHCGGAKAAWFKDTRGNILALIQTL
jgi:hypothetical protein